MKIKLAFAHNLPIGGAKRSFFSLLPLLAKNYNVTVHEFEGKDNEVLGGHILRLDYHRCGG